MVLGFGFRFLGLALRSQGLDSKVQVYNSQLTVKGVGCRV
jgi:hypothetical protein